MQLAWGACGLLGSRGSAALSDAAPRSASSALPAWVSLLPSAGPTLPGASARGLGVALRPACLCEPGSQWTLVRKGRGSQRFS